MPYHPRIECENLPNFTTTRSRNCELWFTGSYQLEQSILGHLAQLQERYGVILYAFAMEGSHKHEVACFPGGSRAPFFRDFNSATTRAVQRFSSSFPGGSLWARRYSNEFIIGDQDVEKQFFYTVLQPIQDGLVKSIDEYPGYNCFYDAVYGKEREYEVVNWTRYNSDRRWKKNIRIEEYTTTYTLQYARLPGYEELSQNEYAELMILKLKERTRELVHQREKAGKKFMGREKLLKVSAGTRAKNPKTSSRWSFRPRFICSCSKTLNAMLKWYFSMLNEFSEASYKFRIEGFSGAKFPPGMYKPPNFTCTYLLLHEDILAAEAS
ncbi:MAG: hypothetical protein KDD60_03770 [Bdellovibrionales bacterium]|nr:hypothetical protein [Bdellovibrionales bacterium]